MFPTKPILLFVLIGLFLLLSVCCLAAEEAGSQSAPEWLIRLFPYTGKPDRFQHRLRRIDAAEVQVDGHTFGMVTVELMYPGLEGKDETAQARIFLPSELKADPSRQVPLMHNAGYEADEKGAAGLVKRGYAVSTPHAHPLNPLGRGINVDTAILHAARQLPCVDSLRVSVQGGSAGGWMTLMLTADAFPLVCSLPDVPPIHWGYNAAYLGENHHLAGPPPGSDKPRLPYLNIVGPIADQTKALYGMPYDSDTFLAVSPLAHLETITVPTMVTCSTADILVPIDQVSPRLVKPRDAKLFPEGYTSVMTDRFPGMKGKRTLLEVLPRGAYEVFTVPLPDDLPRVKAGGTLPPGTKPLKMPFSKTKLWNIVVMDEGPIVPESAHSRYAWGMDHEPFRQWAAERGVTADQLTRPKLERLMKRLRGEYWQQLKIRPGGKGEVIAGNLLDYPEAERADVALGLTAFAADDACALQLYRVYARLPFHLQALGTLGDGTAEGVRAVLKALLHPRS